MPSDSFNLGSGGVLELSAELMRQFNGPKGLAEKFRVTFDGASEANQRSILVEVAKIMGNAAEVRGAADVNKMSTSQLKEAAMRLIREHNGTLPWVDKPKEGLSGQAPS
jgi:predicted deacylase